MMTVRLSKSCSLAILDEKGRAEIARDLRRLNELILAIGIPAIHLKPWDTAYNRLMEMLVSGKPIRMREVNSAFHAPFSPKK